jgi:hypothetical protein
MLIATAELTRTCSGWHQNSGGDSKTLATAEAQAVMWLNLLVGHPESNSYFPEAKAFNSLV